MKHLFTEDINKITLNSNEDKSMHSIDPIETYTYWMRSSKWKRRD